MSEVVLKEDLYLDLGYRDGYDLIETRLEKAGLTRPDKSGIAKEKKAVVAEVLAAHFIRVCTRGDCKAEAEKQGSRTRLAAASNSDCEICGGSINARAVDDMVEALNRAGLSRLCIVGGSPNARNELDSLVNGRLDLRLVNGLKTRNSTLAKADLAWADLVVVWGGTQLDHKVSTLYTGPTVISLARRSIRDLAAEVVASVDIGGGRRRRRVRR